MSVKFKCENCLKETLIRGEGNVSITCQSCGCGDIKFDKDVILAPVSVKDPGKIQGSVLVKGGESFLGHHLGGSLWSISFSVPKTPPETPPAAPPRIKRRGGG